MKHLVLGGTGTVGSVVVRELLGRGEEVRVLTRSEQRAHALPEGVAGFVGDLIEPGTYEPAFTRIDTVFLLVGNNITELHEGLAALAEARRAGVHRVVYLSASNLEQGRHIPHLAAKLAIEQALRESGVPFTILRPNNFYQNDSGFEAVIRRFGVYPQPIGRIGLSRVDVGDIGVAAVNALTQPGHEGRTYTLVGPEALTGPDCAAAYGEALGREVRYGGDDLTAFAAQAKQWLPAWLVWDLVHMYGMFQEKGMVATEEHLAETREILGRAPQRFGDFVRSTIERWQERDAVAGAA